ncbi:MAG TPA: hypothetical protein VED40_10775 [Azospirillaceae bacterium]|nr:hypothetical protein [Azospirillaceae bacterium]
MRIALTAAALVIAAGFTAPALAQQAQVAPQTEAAGPAAEKLSTADVRKIAKEHIAANKMRGVKPGHVTTTADGHKVELLSMDGVAYRTLYVDAAGKITAIR